MPQVTNMPHSIAQWFVSCIVSAQSSLAIYLRTFTPDPHWSSIPEHSGDAVLWTIKLPLKHTTVSESILLSWHRRCSASVPTFVSHSRHPENKLQHVVLQKSSAQCSRLEAPWLSSHERSYKHSASEFKLLKAVSTQWTQGMWPAGLHDDHQIFCLADNSCRSLLRHRPSSLRPLVTRRLRSHPVVLQQHA